MSRIQEELSKGKYLMRKNTMKEAHHASRGPEPYERGLVRIGPRIYLPTKVSNFDSFSKIFPIKK